MNHLLSYRGLDDPRISASDKNLPVQVKYLGNIRHRMFSVKILQPNILRLVYCMSSTTNFWIENRSSTQSE